MIQVHFPSTVQSPKGDLFGDTISSPSWFSDQTLTHGDGAK